MEEEQVQGNPSEDSVPGEVDVASSEGQENATDRDVTGLAELVKDATGREFGSDEEALKSLQETYKFVGKAGQAEKQLKEVQAELTRVKSGDNSGLQEQVAALEKTINEDKFYEGNPEYAKYRQLIGSIGGDPSEVVGSDVFKSVYQKAEAGDKAESAKSVLETNPRLGAASDKMSKARQALSEGNDLEANAQAIGSVIDAFGLDK